MPGVADRILIVEARDLDTDERTLATFEVKSPADDAGQRDQLTRVVGRLHPEARMRSFGGGAASFLDSRQLIVAHYAAAARPETPAEARAVDHAAQQPLFAI